MSFINPDPGSCSVLVMDNCHIHHGEEVWCLVEDVHHKFPWWHCNLTFFFFWVCKLIDLPTYSPDYNPIEQAFSSIKAYLHIYSKSLPFCFYRLCSMLTIEIQGARSVCMTLKMSTCSCIICRSLMHHISMCCLQMMMVGTYTLRTMPNH